MECSDQQLFDVNKPGAERRRATAEEFARALIEMQESPSAAGATSALLVSTPWISVPELKFELEKLCRDTNWLTRIRAAWILQWENMPSDAIIPVFKGCLESADEDQRFLACTYIGQSEALASEFKEQTGRLLADPSEGVRIAAASANFTSPTISFGILKNALHLDNYLYQIYSAVTLLKRDFYVKEAMNLLCRAFTDPNPEVPMSAATLIGLAGRGAVPFVRALLEGNLTAPVPPQAMVLATQCLRGMKDDFELRSSLERFLIERVKHGRIIDVVQLAPILASMGGVTENVLVAVVEELSADHFERRGAAALVLDNFGPSAAPTIPKLLARLRAESEPPVCRSIISACVGIGESTFEPLFEMACELDMRHFVLAISGIASLVTKGIVPAERFAKSFLRHPNREMRIAGVGMLKLMGPISKAAVPIAAELLRSDDREARVQTLEALVALGVDASPAAGEVVARFLSDDDDEQYLAERTLRAMQDEGARAVQLAMEKCDKQLKPRLKELAKRIGAVGTPGFAPFVWRGNNDLLRLLVAIADIEVDGPVSDEHVVETVLQDSNLTWDVKDLASSKSGLRMSIRDLTAQLRECNPSISKKLVLRNGVAGKKTGLTKAGLQIAELARAWIRRESESHPGYD